MSALGHERRFRYLRGTSAYPPRLAVKADIPDRQVRANTGREQMRQICRARRESYSITSSARTSSVGGISRPSAFAVIRLTASSNLVGCSTGRSAGFAPRRSLST